MLSKNGSLSVRSTLHSALYSLVGGIVAFELIGARDESFAFIDATQWLSITANFGDTKSTITHPASTTHGRLKPEERELAGIGEGLIRVSVGLEDIDDIIAEMQRGLAAVASVGTVAKSAVV